MATGHKLSDQFFDKVSTFAVPTVAVCSTCVSEPAGGFYFPRYRMLDIGQIASAPRTDLLADLDNPAVAPCTARPVFRFAPVVSSSSNSPISSDRSGASIEK